MSHHVVPSSAHELEHSTGHRAEPGELHRRGSVGSSFPSEDKEERERWCLHDRGVQRRAEVNARAQLLVVTVLAEGQVWVHNLVSSKKMCLGEVE